MIRRAIDKRARASAWPGSLLPAAGLALAAGLAVADTLYWDGVNGSWSAAANWSAVTNAATPDPGSAPGTNDTAVFSISTDSDGATVTLGGDRSARGIAMRQGAGNITIQNGGTLTLGDGGIDAWNTHVNSIGAAVRLDGSQVWRCGSGGAGALTVSASVSRVTGDTVDRSLLVQVGTTASLGNVADGGASGALSLEKGGAGVLTLTGANQQSGGTTVYQGQLNVSAASMPTNGPLEVRGTITLDLGGESPVAPGIHLEWGALSLQNAGSGFDMGAVTRGSGALPLGSAPYRLDNANDPSGILGPWAFGPGGRFLCVSNGALATYTNALVFMDPAVLTSATNNYEWFGADAHPWIVRMVLTQDSYARTISMAPASSGNSLPREIYLGDAGDNDITLGGLIAPFHRWEVTRGGLSTGRLIIGYGNELVLAGGPGYRIAVPIVDGSGPGRLTIAKTSASYPVILSGDSTYSGGTDFNAIVAGAALHINGPGALGTGPLRINGAGAVGQVLIDNSDSWQTDVRLTNHNAQVWNCDLAFVGSALLDMGDGPVSLGAVPGTGPRTVEVRDNVFAVGGIANGTHPQLPVTALTKTGAGTLEVNGASTYSGNTTVSAGTLRLGAGASLASTSVNVATGAVLHVTGGENLARGTHIELSGTVNLDAGLFAQVGSLSINAAAMPDGSYGSSASGAGYRDDTHFAGSGVLLVGPPPGILLIVR